LLYCKQLRKYLIMATFFKKNYSGLLQRDREFSTELTTWTTTVKILFVIDGRVNLEKGKKDFGLGFVLDTLRSNTTNWVRFVVDVAKRDNEKMENLSVGPYDVRFLGFRFDQDGFHLSNYDQVWFFGDNPGSDSDLFDPPEDPLMYKEDKWSPLSNEERKILADWMDKGGGVFATGDHGVLGASLGSFIPRVRTMRRWTHDQNVPLVLGTNQNQTLQPSIFGNLEQDLIPQPIEPVLRHVVTSFSMLGSFSLKPHPILLNGNKVIDKFPDHMHEGEVMQDDQVELDRPLEIPGYDRPEYPSGEIVSTASSALFIPASRPRPRVIAYGRTTNEFFPELTPFSFASPVSYFKRFPLIAVYDGDPVQIGRIVVDSTWHHWFSMNLLGFFNAQENEVYQYKQANYRNVGNNTQLENKVYENMQAYYRNVGLWLLKPALRSSILFGAVWNQLTLSAPMEFRGPMTSWEMGKKMTESLEKETSSGMVAEMVGSLMQNGTMNDPSRHTDLETPSAVSHLPSDLSSHAIIGSIGMSLRELATPLLDAQTFGKKHEICPEELIKAALDGATKGSQLMIEALDEAVKQSSALLEKIKAGYRKIEPDAIPLPLKTVNLTIIPERLQFPTESDPSLHANSLSFTVRILIKGLVIASQIVEIDIPKFNQRGALVPLKIKPFQIQVQTGEELKVEVLVGKWWLERVDAELIRFEDTLKEKPSLWIGSHLPGISQPWRLWYSVLFTKNESAS
jgi:hypothetical protein